MTGIIFASIATLFSEISDSLGKREVSDHKESVYTMGFLNLFWGTVFLLVIAFVRQSFIFNFASWPTFGLRALLEIAQVHVGILAIVKADRSAYSLIRMATIPLLLFADLFLGYTIGYQQIGGIAIIFIALAILFLNRGLAKEGLGLVVFTTINAVITISLFKYNITHFNSVEAEQVITHIVLMIYLFCGAYFIARENPLAFFGRPIFLTQSVTSGSGSVLASFAYVFAPASVITAATRSFAVFWALLAGNIYFHEKHLILKIASLMLVVLGIILLI